MKCRRNGQALQRKEDRRGVYFGDWYQCEGCAHSVVLGIGTRQPTGGGFLGSPIIVKPSSNQVSITALIHEMSRIAEEDGSC